MLKNYNTKRIIEQLKAELHEEEEYLWDMRFWTLKKPKKEFTPEDVINQIDKWIADKDILSNNCGHCLYCIKLLLGLNLATKQEIAKAVLANNKVKLKGGE